MTEESQTFTMNEAPADQPELTEEEMDSLQVGEQMQEAQDKRLAGKYENAEELEKAYLNLEKKLGEPKTEEEKEEANPPKDEKESKETEESDEQISVLDKLWSEKDVGFTDETLKELASTNPGELAKSYLQYRNQTEQPKELTAENITELKNVVGGEEAYDRMVDWAKDTLPADQQEMFDHVVDSGDPVACFFAIQVLQSKYEDATGSDGQLITGKAPSSSGNQFRSQAELVKAMADPRYDRDPAYRRDIQEKLARSEVSF